MANTTNTIYNIRYLDEIAQKNTVLHQLHPLVKLLVSMVYIIITVSYGKYEIAKFIPLTLYPILLFNIGEIPFFPLFKRCLMVLPFVLGLGIFNPIMDREILVMVSQIGISGGWISYASLILKCLLTVLCALLLISTTGIEKIAAALRCLRVPKIFVVQLLLTYRYISVLLEEVGSIWTAYSLRAPAQKGIHYRSWGPLLGQLLMRTYDRGQRIYQGMVLRGFHGEYPEMEHHALKLKDYLYLIVWIGFFLLVRFYNIPILLENLLTGGQL